MSTNPLFPSGSTPKNDYVLSRPEKPTVTPQDNPAANLIRKKLDALYAEEPNAQTELAEAEASASAPSKHQQFITQLQTSGKNLAEIQTAWHEYYTQLPDEEKQQVWQEFYDRASSSHWSQYFRASNPTPVDTPAQQQPISIAPSPADGQAVVSNQSLPPSTPPSTLADLRQRIKSHVQAQGQLKTRHHLQSLGFGLASGMLVLVIFLFSFFNQVVITPFIQPSRKVSNLPLIIDSSTVAASSAPEVIIPKINVEIPVDFTQTSTDESVIENALNSGVVHYPNTVLPGQNGNAAFFGHSSNNIFNPGKYKFAFVLLHTLTNGDTFYLTNQGKVYAYQVIDHKIVPPSDVGVLSDTEGHQATATLITCDPPGTSINRLVVTGVQISPDPGGDTAPTGTPVSSSPTALPGNGPSLWSRLIKSIF